MQQEKGLAIQQWQVREAVKQFPGSTVHELAARSLIPREVFHRRLIELERLGFVAKDHDGVYHAIPLKPREQIGGPIMWHFVNAMTYETATHRIRRVSTPRESYWLAERKASPLDLAEKIHGHFATQELAELACERDLYAVASGR